MSSCYPARTIARREWSAYFNSPVAYVFIIFFLILTGFFTFAVSRFYESNQAELSRSFFIWHPWLYLVLVPAVGMRLWSEERRSHTIELLFTMPVTPMQAIFGKFLAAWLFLILALALTFPVVWTATYLGDPDLGVVFTGYVGSALLAGSYLSVSMFTSALTKNQVISFIVAVVLGLFLILAGYPPVTDLLSRFLPVAIVDGVAAVSFMSHFETMQRGILDLRDILYFASVIGFMLFGTHVVLHHKAAM
jgi:ABC-2 type transport system permease protein